MGGRDGISGHPAIYFFCEGFPDVKLNCFPRRMTWKCMNYFSQNYILSYDEFDD